ncbi:hypothetical protein F7725_008731 [Dissostichus mawsoni]|uniref:Zinc finger and BTB domain-containing protein 24 n=1 Tax=Dissostichus mawsoni TaxID=36200 RepID=A0A7J5YB62_DISMA|nr:hypothetical protein F7725_008731 [Dissostichus mawsoni]
MKDVQEFGGTKNGLNTDICFILALSLFVSWRLFFTSPSASIAVPQAKPHPGAQDSGSFQRGLQGAAALQNAPSVIFIHLQVPVSPLPSSSDSDPLDPWEDVREAVPVADEVLQPGSLHLQDLASNRLHGDVCGQRARSQARAVYDDPGQVAAALTLDGGERLSEPMLRESNHLSLRHDPEPEHQVGPVRSFIFRNGDGDVGKILRDAHRPFVDQLCANLVRITTLAIVPSHSLPPSTAVVEDLKMSPASNRSSIRSLHSHSHQQSILGKLNTFRQQDLLCDVTLQVHDEAFRAHKALLAASSDHFLFLFTSKPQSVYRLQDTLSNVLQFIYSAQVCVEEDKVCVEEDNKVCVEDDVTQQLLAAAKLLQEVSKRKRGRPSKTDLQKEDSETADVLHEDEVTDVLHEDEVTDVLHEDEVTDVLHEDAESESKDDADFNPVSRQSKRKIRPPVKYKSYRVSGEETGSREPGKRGRKRKYPDTEARCEDCGKVFKNHLFLKIHQRTHTGETINALMLDRRAIQKSPFTQKHTLLVHQRSHSGEKPFICNVCSKSLSTKHALQEHMHLHQGEKPFGCDKCGKTFTQKRQLKSHYRVHTGKSLPECAQCHHKFMDTAQLKKHLRTHTGE